MTSPMESAEGHPAPSNSRSAGKSARTPFLRTLSVWWYNRCRPSTTASGVFLQRCERPGLHTTALMGCALRQLAALRRWDFHPFGKHCV